MTDVPATVPAPPPPSPPPGAPSYLTQYAGRIEDLQRQDDAAFQQEQSALAPRYSALQKALSIAPPKPPDQTPLPKPPAPENFQQNSMAFASAMAVLGAVASSFTRASGTAALSAFAGAINGWKQGNLQAYENASKQWEQATKQTIENNRMVLEKYRQVLENRKLNIDQQMASIQTIAAQFHDKLTYDAAAAKNYTLVASIYEKNAEFTQKTQEAAAKLQEQRDKDQQKNEQSAAYWLSPRGQAQFATLDPTQQAAVKQMIEIYGAKASKGGMAGQLIAQENSEREARGEPAMTAREEIEFVQSIHPPRSAPAMALDAFKRQFAAEHGGRPPTAEEITQFAGSYAGTTAEERAVGQRAGAIAIAVNEAHKTIPNVLAAAEKSAGKGLATWNAVENKWKVERGDEDFANYVAMMNSLVNVYGRVISGGGKGTVSDLEHARQNINPNMPLSAVKGALRAFQTEIDIAEKAPGEVRNEMRGGGGGASASGDGGGVIHYDANGNRVP